MQPWKLSSLSCGTLDCPNCVCAAGGDGAAHFTYDLRRPAQLSVFNESFNKLFIQAVDNQWTLQK